MSAPEPLPAQPAVPAPRPGLPSFGILAAAISILGFGSLCFLAGSAAIYFQLPGVSGPIGEGLAGANQWLRADAVPTPVPGSEPLSIVTDTPGGTWDGLTLVTTTDISGGRLLNMAGEEVHCWTLPSDAASLKKMGEKAPTPGTHLHFEQCHALPNGDLLGICCAGGDTPYGFALVKLDKKSNLLWALPGSFHHDLDVDDRGQAYVIESGSAVEKVAGFETLPVPHQADVLVVVSPEGKVERRVPVLEAFKGSPYLISFVSGDITGGFGPSMRVPTTPALPGTQTPAGTSGPPAAGAMGLPGAPSQEQIMVSSGDVLHTNSVHVLRREQAGKFPLFKAGQVLLSLRSPSLLAVLDLQKRSIVWAARGPWHTQHSALFLDNGRLLLFDNMGDVKKARVLEYDPHTQAVPWAFLGEKDSPFLVPYRGRCQRLPNGNTLVVYPGRWVGEVSTAGDTVWKLAYPESAAHAARNITGARRYAADQLSFLGAVSPRPR
jgi:hypothetical protein